MSWLVDLAVKAEDLLNLVDQGAATALSKSKEGEVILDSAADYIGHDLPEKPKEKHPNFTKPAFISSAAGNIKNQKATLLAGTANVKPVGRMTTETSRSAPIASSHSGPISSSHSTPIAPSHSAPSLRTSSHFVRRKKSEPDDEQLFDFLNSSEKVHNGALESRRESSREASGHSAPTNPNSANTTQSASPKTERKTPGKCFLLFILLAPPKISYLPAPHRIDFCPFSVSPTWLSFE